MARECSIKIINVVLVCCLTFVIGTIFFNIFGNHATEALAKATVHIDLGADEAEATAKIFVNVPVHHTEIPKLELPEINLPEIKPPKLPAFKLPAVPNFKLPKLPTIKLPTIKFPNLWEIIKPYILYVRDLILDFFEKIRIVICDILAKLHAIISLTEDWIRCNLVKEPSLFCKSTLVYAILRWTDRLTNTAEWLKLHHDHGKDFFLVFLANLALSVLLVFCSFLVYSFMSWLEKQENRNQECHQPNLKITVNVTPENQS